MQGYPPPSGYGPPPSHQGYGPAPGYYAGGPPPKKGMNGCLLVLLVVGGMCVLMFGGCVVLGMIGAAGSHSSNTVSVADTTNSTGAAPTQTSTPDPKPTATAATATKRVGMEVTGRTLYGDYEANEVAADEKYKGRRLLVKGLVTSIDKDFLDHIIVHFAGGAYDFETVMATLQDSEKKNAAKLSKGDVIKVACKGGTKIISSPTLDDCTVVSMHEE